MIIITIVEMKYKPERALTPIIISSLPLNMDSVEMKYKPERALTHFFVHFKIITSLHRVEMKYKPERALTLLYADQHRKQSPLCRNEV